jgi:hypothetical protein
LNALRAIFERRSIIFFPKEITRRCPDKSLRRQRFSRGRISPY